MLYFIINSPVKILFLFDLNRKRKHLAPTNIKVSLIHCTININNCYTYICINNVKYNIYISNIQLVWRSIIKTTELIRMGLFQEEMFAVGSKLLSFWNPLSSCYFFFSITIHSRRVMANIKYVNNNMLVISEESCCIIRLIFVITS